MSEIVPLRSWYPAMYDKWSNRRRVAWSDRTHYVHHHTVGGAGIDALTYARQVADQHWRQWGVPGGYGVLVGTDGVLREMCGLDYQGVHSGTHEWNRRGIGLAYQGDFRTWPPSDVMLDAARSLIAAHPLDQTTHRAVRPEPTSCPGNALIALLPLEADMPLDANDLAAIKTLLEAHDETFDYTNSAGHTRRMSRLAVNSTWHVDIAGRRAMDLLANLKDLPTADVKAIAKAVNDEFAKRVAG